MLIHARCVVAADLISLTPYTFHSLDLGQVYGEFYS